MYFKMNWEQGIVKRAGQGASEDNSTFEALKNIWRGELSTIQPQRHYQRVAKLLLFYFFLKYKVSCIAFIEPVYNNFFWPLRSN